MPKERSPLRNQVESAALSALFRLFSMTTREHSEAFGRNLGSALRFLLSGRRHLVENNLARAFPEKSREEIRTLAKDVFRHFGGMACDLMWLESRSPEKVVESVEISGLVNAKEAHASGRGFFFVTAHIGNWELGALAMSMQGIPILVIARPLDNPLLETRLRRFREQTGNTVISKRDAARQIFRTLKQGGGIGILPDQHARPPDAIEVPFLGRPASTTTAIARFLLKTGALVLPVTATRVAPGRYHMIIEKTFDIRNVPEAERTQENLTVRINGILENMIRRTPEQWLWLHNRWRLD